MVVLLFLKLHQIDGDPVSLLSPATSDRVAVDSLRSNSRNDGMQKGMPERIADIGGKYRRKYAISF
jgi:hypothetical protein